MSDSAKRGAGLRVVTAPHTPPLPPLTTAESTTTDVSHPAENTSRGSARQSPLQSEGLALHSPQSDLLTPTSASPFQSAHPAATEAGQHTSSVGGEGERRIPSPAPDSTTTLAKSASLLTSPPILPLPAGATQSSAHPPHAASGARAARRQPQRPSVQPGRRSSTLAATHRSSQHAPMKHFAKGSEVSCANFYFYGEDVASFGVGTVGLYSAKTVTAAAPATTAHGDAHAGLGDDGRGNGLGGTLSATAGRRQLVSMSPTFLAPIGEPSAWEQREDRHRRWKSRYLATSSYAKLSQAPPPTATATAGTAEDAAVMEDGPGLAMTFPGPRGYPDLPALWCGPEQRALERRRLRGIAAERTAKAHADAKSRRDYDTRVLQHRARKLKGEAVDLPDSYFRLTYPDPTDPKGFTAPTVAMGGEAHGGVMGDYDPQRVAKDHLRACQLHRLSQQQRNLTEEARRQEVAETDRRTTAKHLEERRSEADAFRTAWMSDRPRVSRSREAQRHDHDDAQKRAAAQLNHALRDHARELYARYATESQGEKRAHQRDLRKRVLSRPQSRNNGGARPGSGRLGAATTSRAPSPLPSSPPQQQHHQPVGGVAATAAAAPPPSSSSYCGAAAAAAARPGTGCRELRPMSPPPSQLVGPTSTNFFNEVKQWTQEYASPNTIPPNAAEPAHRRAWKADLEAAQQRFNRETTQRHREEYPRRLLEAREKTQETHWTQAEVERKERKSIAVRRADQAQAGLVAATAMRVGLQEEERRAQVQRQVLAAERRDDAQLQRLHSQMREEALRNEEAQELLQLRMTVSANATRA